MSQDEFSAELEMELWKQKAIKIQSFYFQWLGDRTWEQYTDSKNDIIHLKNKLGFLLFGSPTDEKSDDCLENVTPVKEETNNITDTDSDNNASSSTFNTFKDDIHASYSGKNKTTVREELCPICSNKANQTEENYNLEECIICWFLYSLKEENSIFPNGGNNISKIPLSARNKPLKSDFVKNLNKNDSENIKTFIDNFFGQVSLDEVKTYSEEHITEDYDPENVHDYSKGDTDFEHASSISSSRNLQMSGTENVFLQDYIFNDNEEYGEGYAFENESTDDFSENYSKHSRNNLDSQVGNSKEFSKTIPCSAENALQQSATENDSANLRNLSTVKNDEFRLYYTQLNQINKLLESIVLCSDKPNKKNKDIFIAFIFVIAKIDCNIAEFPVIRVLCGKNKDIIKFLDTTGRCYTSWDDFLQNNCFPCSIYCYPKNGFYTDDQYGNVVLEFDKSPESKFLRKFTKYADFTSGIVGFGCGLVVLGSLAIPIAAPAMIGCTAAGIASGLWSTSRAVYQLVDKHTHGEKLNDQDARGCWINVAVGILGAASLGSFTYTQYLAQNGNVIGKVTKLIINSIEISNTGVSGINIANQAYNMYENGTINYVDVAGLAMSILFFCHGAMKFKTAEKMLNDHQNEVINNIQSQLSSKERRAFRQIIKGTTATDLTEGNACIIKTVMNIEDPKTYFKDVSKVTKAAYKSRSSVSFSGDASGKLKINGKLTVEPEIVNSMSYKSKNKMFNSSKKFNQNVKHAKTFNKNMKLISKHENLTFRKATFELQRKVNVKTMHAFKQNGKNIFPSVTSNDVRNVNGLLKELKNDKCTVEIKLIVIMEARKTNCNNLYTFIQILFKVLLSLANGEAKDKYDRLMKYYEENLRETFESIIEAAAEIIIKNLFEAFSEKDKNLITAKHTFYRLIKMENIFTPWNYFETYLRKLSDFVPDRESVIVIPQKVGWLFMLSNHLNIHSVYITTIRMSAKDEKISMVVFMKFSCP